MCFSVESSSSQEGQLVCILTDGRNSDHSHPIVVGVAKLVGQHLEFVNIKGTGIEDDVVTGWGNCSLLHRLGDEEELHSFRSDDI